MDITITNYQLCIRGDDEKWEYILFTRDLELFVMYVIHYYLTTKQIVIEQQLHCLYETYIDSTYLILYVTQHMFRAV